VDFEQELNRVLPPDIPHRENLVAKSAEHLRLIVEANEYLNLTRIVSPSEAAIKHVLDSVIPWLLFAKAERVIDAGTGAGFPGIPLALILPDARFTLTESIQKKARFVESALAQLDLPNVTILPQRAEELAGGQGNVITARALAPVERAIRLFSRQLKAGTKLLLYKGRDTDEEIATASKDAQRLRLKIRVALRYELPDGMGSRSIVEVVT
jgi:16S rRNA (guanine527-N7)-methyltransferase